MNSDFVKKVALYKELFDANTITEEQYLSFIKDVVNEQTKDVVASKDLSFEAKKEELVEETRRKSADLRERISEYEKKGALEEQKRLEDKKQNEDISFAIQFLSQIVNSNGERVYSDELLEDETKMSLYEMQSLIENIKNSAPERYNKIVSKIDPSKVIEVVNAPAVNEQQTKEEVKEVEEQQTKEEKEVTTGLPDGYSDPIVNITTGPDYSGYVEMPTAEVNNEAVNTPEVVAIEQPKPTMAVDLTNEDQAKNDLDDYLTKNGITNEDQEMTNNLLEEEKPRRPKLITRAKDTLVNAMRSKSGKVNADAMKIMAVVAGVAAGVIALSTGALGAGAAILAGGSVAIGAADELLKKIK